MSPTEDPPNNYVTVKINPPKTDELEDHLLNILKTIIDEIKEKQNCDSTTE